MRSFVKIKSSRNGEITDIEKIIHLSRNFNIANMYFNAIRENRLIAKISEFTVVVTFFVVPVLPGD